MPGETQAFLGRQPIVDRRGELLGYELLYRAAAHDDRARFDDEDSASLQVLSTLLHDLGAPQVLAGKQAFINVGPNSLRDTGALVLLNPRRTVLELSRAIEPDAEMLARIRMLREMGFGIAVSAEPPIGSLAPWLGTSERSSVVSHLKVDLRRVPAAALGDWLAALRGERRMVIAEKVETQEQAQRCLGLGFDGLQGWYVGRPEVMGSVKPGVSHAVIRRALDALSAGRGLDEVESSMRLDVALCWRLLRYTAASNFGMMIPVESLRHAIELVGARRLARWLQLLLNTVDEPSPAAGTLSRVAVIRGRMLELLGAEYFEGADCDNLFLVGAFSMLPAMLMQPIGEIVAALALPDAVADALTQRQGRYGPLLELAEAMESGSSARVEALCDQLTLSGDMVVRAQRAAQATVRNAAVA